VTFTDLGLHPALLAAVAKEGYNTPTPIQERAIPAVLTGTDLLAAAQTGTGKTAAFVLPILHRLATVPSHPKRQPRVLVLTPTRELAAQVAESVANYGQGLHLRHAVIFGGVGHQPQVDAFKRGLDIVIATPGRLLEHANDRTADLSHVETFILDEADRMLDMGFIHDIKKVLKMLPAKRQNLLFSATFSDEIRSLAKTFLTNPQEIDIAPRNTTVESVAQKITLVEQRHKRELLVHLIKQGDWQQVLVFARMKHGANRICDHLNANGIGAAALHGNKSQTARTKALADFKANRIKVLVATDIAARGIDIDNLPHVINFELPNVPEDYVHRIGRTGRAGMKGEALSFVASDERQELKDIQRVIKREIPVLQVEGFVPRNDAVAINSEPRPPRPPQGGRGRSGGGAGNGGAKAGAPRGNGGGQPGRGPRPGGGGAPGRSGAPQPRSNGGGRSGNR